ncbi:MAG: PadR family transcriptional regulator [Propionibacteriaceae bacterium]|nr:PadR family transcriptional regulator [Propionibacteriaceae bacterium]
MTKHRHSHGHRPESHPHSPFEGPFPFPGPPLPGGHGEDDDFHGRHRGRRPHPEGPEGPGRPPHGSHPPFGEPPHHRHGGRGRRRGEVRTAVLLLLSEESMHGYQLMQTIAERTDGAWSPSPGAIYPTLSQLEDEGLVVVDGSGGRKQASLTEAGQAYVAEHREQWSSPLVAGDGPKLRELMHSLGDAVRQVGRNGTDAQREQVAKELTETRRRIYLILAEAE